MKSIILLGVRFGAFCTLIAALLAGVFYVYKRPSTTVPPQPPPPPSPTCSVDPRTGSSSEVQFSVTCSESTDYKKISAAGLLINSLPDGARGCYVVYVPPQSELRLIDDDGVRVLQVELGANRSTENSACAVIADRFEVLGRKNTLSFKVGLRFKPGFSGPRNIYVTSQTNEGGDTGMELHGVWRVP